METVQAATIHREKTAASTFRGKPKCLPFLFVVMLRLLRFATPQAPPSMEQRSATSLLTWWRFSSMVRGRPSCSLRRSFSTSGDVGVTAMLVGSLAEAASAACDRVLRGLPASSTMRELIARALGSRRRVGGRCEAVVLGRCGGCCTGVTGPRPRAPRATPDRWSDRPSVPGASAGARAGRLAWWGLPARGLPPAKERWDGPREPPSRPMRRVFGGVRHFRTFLPTCCRCAQSLRARANRRLASSTRSRRFAALPRSAALPTALCDAWTASVQRRRV